VSIEKAEHHTAYPSFNIEMIYGTACRFANPPIRRQRTKHECRGVHRMHQTISPTW